MKRREPDVAMRSLYELNNSTRERDACGIGFIADGTSGLQVLNYLAASKLKSGLLVNFGEDSLVWKRVIL